ncbi:alpha/beta fold hydrolase [Symbioplanes lichenis]|uniref:alpha/beta fold hydrolase n=1 Tax=Symbioplanes lichenis TaxID=1629072 RepID=UPI0027399AC3|nr:alpha/beta hydrolase [Actinoplanes lichenis]
MTVVLLPMNTGVTDESTAATVRAWGGDPDAGHTIAAALTEAGYRVVAFDYEKEVFARPRPLSGDRLAADLLAAADEAGAERFAYYGYSWLGLAGLQLAQRTDRVTALAVGGFPPLGGPYEAMLKVTRAAHEQALHPVPAPAEVTPGDWESAGSTVEPAQTEQFVTLYESLQGLDEPAQLDRITVPGLAYAGAADSITYGPGWGDTEVVIGPALAARRTELEQRGWTVHLEPGADHLKALHASVVLPVLLPWLREHVPA